MRSLEENNIAKYLFEAHYGAEGVKGLAKEGGSGRRAAIAKMADVLGGRLEMFYTRIR
jgi:hypothetical protein